FDKLLKRIVGTSVPFEEIRFGFYDEGVTKIWDCYKDWIHMFTSGCDWATSAFVLERVGVFADLCNQGHTTGELADAMKEECGVKGDLSILPSDLARAVSMEDIQAKALLKEVAPKAPSEVEGQRGHDDATVRVEPHPPKEMSQTAAEGSYTAGYAQGDAILGLAEDPASGKTKNDANLHFFSSNQLGNQVDNELEKISKVFQPDNPLSET
ncbi:hypothetical protein CYMTET_30783, partial [Cymbomonas tetramitiformis]